MPGDGYQRRNMRGRTTPSPTDGEDMPSAPTKSPLVNAASAEERAAAGKAAREKVPRSSHGEWEPPARRRDPVKVLEDQAKSRVPELVPIRYGRMLASPFTFFRGAAAIMAMDLAKTPQSGLRVQACGDAHLSNFGVFAAPDRRLVVDVNDFDETLPGPWEWDLKRLAASFAIAGRDRDFTPKETRAAVLTTARAYREAMREFATMRNLDVWYARLDVESLLADLAKVADRQADEGGAARTSRRPTRRTASRPSIASSGWSTASRGSSATRRCSSPPESSLRGSGARSSRSGSRRCSAATARASRGTAATSSTATDSSRWPARWSGSEASGPAPGWS